MAQVTKFYPKRKTQSKLAEPCSVGFSTLQICLACFFSIGDISKQRGVCAI